MSPNIYLDIDCVLLINDLYPSECAEDLIDLQTPDNSDAEQVKIIDSIIAVELYGHPFSSLCLLFP